MRSFPTLADPLVAADQLRRERDRLRRPIEQQAEAWISGRSSASVRLQEEVDRVACTPGTTVLLVGPEGSGKELVAHAIHGRSCGNAGPMNVLPCGSLDTDLFETLLEDGCGGTSLLSDIELLPRRAQARLAQSLGAARRSPLMKGQAPSASPTRLIASTSANLDEMATQGAFDDELCYRLNVLVVHVPSLHDRRADMPDIAGSLAETLDRRGSKRHLDIVGKRALGAQEWPGGWRQLMNVLERAALLTKGLTLDARFLWETPSPAVALPSGEDRSLKTLEATWIERVLEEEAGNRSSTARALGINRATLYNKLRDYGIA